MGFDLTAQQLGKDTFTRFGDPRGTQQRQEVEGEGNGVACFVEELVIVLSSEVAEGLGSFALVGDLVFLRDSAWAWAGSSKRFSRSRSRSAGLRVTNDL